MTIFALLALAILPGFIIVHRYYAKDHLQKEPMGVILRSFFWGAAFVIPVGMFECLFTLGKSPTKLDLAIYYILLVGLSEEVAKYLAIRFYSARNNAFNEYFDGIVYGACVGGGFATFENVFYVLEHGFAVGIVRAFLSVPGHILWGAIIGHWIAKECLDKESMVKTFVLGVGIAALLHGSFDFILSCGSTTLLMAPIFVITPLVLVRMYSKTALEQDQVFIFGKGSILPVIEKSSIAKIPLVFGLLKILLYLLSGLFSLFGIFLTIFSVADYFQKAPDFETWMFSLPVLSYLLAIGLFRYGRKFSR